MSDQPTYKFIDKNTIAVRVREHLRADTAMGQTQGLLSLSRAIRVRYKDFVFVGVDGQGDNRWFIFKCTKKEQ